MSSSYFRLRSILSFSNFIRLSSFSIRSLSLAASLSSLSCSRMCSLARRSFSLASSFCFFSSSRIRSFSCLSCNKASSLIYLVRIRSCSFASLSFSLSWRSCSIYRRFSSSFWARICSLMAFAWSFVVISLRFCTSLMYFAWEALTWVRSASCFAFCMWCWSFCKAWMTLARLYMVSRWEMTSRRKAGGSRYRLGVANSQDQIASGVSSAYRSWCLGAAP